MDKRNEMLDNIRKIEPVIPDIPSYMYETETVNLDETERAKAAIRTADILKGLSKKVDALTDALEMERQLRRESEIKQEKQNKVILRIAWITLTISVLTLLANWGAVILAILFR